MNWLRKMRRGWIAVLSRFTRHRKSTGGGSNGGGGKGNGLVKLQDDVEMCGYEDVRNMWDILNKVTPKSCETTPDCDVCNCEHPKIGIGNGTGNDNYGNTLTLFFGRHSIDTLYPSYS